MAFDVFVWCSVAWMLVMTFMMDTSNFQSTLCFKIAPFVIACGTAVTWAMSKGFILNTGGM